MQGNQLQKAIDLSRKTGDRLIVFDRAESANPYVIMSLDDYERLAIGQNEVRGLTETELLDKINRDVAVWKSENEFSGFEDEIGDFQDINDIYNYNAMDNFNADETEYARKKGFYSPEFGGAGDSLKKRKSGRGNNWSIPSDRKRGAEEVSENKEEDRQYLEEIPF